MKVLITGATGLVGQELVQQCHKNNIQVNYLTTRKGKIVNQEGYQGFYWNPETSEIDANCLEGVSVIINLAGASISKRWTNAYKKTVLNSRLDSLQLLKKLLTENTNHTVSLLVSASAIGIYPNSLTNFYVEENNEVDDSFLGHVVKAWEDTLKDFDSLNIKIAAVRIGLVLSKDGGALPEIAKPVKYGLGAAFGNGEQWQSWIHISDLAAIFLHISKEKLEGVYNGVAPNPVTNAKLTKAVAKTLKRPLFLPNIPKVIMRAILGEMAYIVFASQRVSSKKIEKKGFVFTHPNINGALDAIYHKTTQAQK